MDDTPLLRRAKSLQDELIRWRRDFHQHPELAFNEHRSAGIIESHLNSLGYRVETGIAVTGLVGVLDGPATGRKLMLRFDMDALPVHEANELSYASQQPGVMHACGHDGHMAIGMGVARLLANDRDELAGTVELVFQPAEEGEGGAAQMIEAGLLDRLQPDAAVALHLWNELPLGTMATAPGPVMAGADRFVIKVRGRGGHAALPDKTLDPVPASAALIQALQTIASRSVDPQGTFVLSVTRVHGGDAFNIIPDSVELEGTVRYYSSVDHDRALEKMELITQGTAAAYGCTTELELFPIAPPVRNDPQITLDILQHTRSAFSSFDILDDYRVMGSEDMAFFLDRVPGCYLFLGSSDLEQGLTASHHSPHFNFDEKALVFGTAWLVSIAHHLLGTA
jgi:amidohydrolase